ncbi:putative exonuclease [Vibrio phage 1.161.O._10N.261.48.C5]|nr:putative exonuclease [Vibrio phage 1.161.O._10N.261.48.C5]
MTKAKALFAKFSIYELEKDRIQDVLSAIKKNSEVFQQYKFNPPSATEKERMGFSETLLGGGYVGELPEGLLLRITQQGKSINRNEVKDVSLAKELLWMEENKTDFVQKNIKKILLEDSEALVIQKTYPNEEVHGHILLRKDGKVLVEGKGNASERLISLVRKALGSFPALPVQVVSDVNSMLKGWVKSGLNGDIFTLGSKATLLSELGTEYVTKGEDISQDPNAMAILKSDDSTVTKVETCFDGVIQVTITDALTFEGVKVDKDLTAGEEDAAMLFITSKEINKMVDDTLGRLNG